MVMGTTGIGKTSIAAMVRPRIGGELVSVDSVKLYKGLRIGSHKVYDPNVQVHMYDVVDVQSHYTAQDYAEAAHKAVRGILDRKKTPIFFGGASMYMEWVLFGTGSAPHTDHAQMEEVEARLRAMSCWDEAYEYARPLDPVAVAAVLRNDYYRLARIVTVVEQEQQQFSSMQGFQSPVLDLDLRGVFVYPSDRTALYRSLDRRCEKMLADGLLEEVAGLLHSHGGHVPRKISTIVGYRQTFDFLQANPGPHVSTDAFRRFLKEFQNATRSYARRQMIYFRRSEKLNSVFRAAPALPTAESTEEVAREIVELYHMSPEEYAADKRWRDPVPMADAGAMRKYVSRAEVFNSDANIEALLERLRRERSRLQALH